LFRVAQPMFHRCALNGDAVFVGDIWSNVDRLSEAKEDVVLDLSRVEFVDSHGAGAMASLTRRLSIKGLQLKIIGLHGQPLRLLLELHLVPVAGTASDSFHA
jgi:anti-anti-sigma regulatory factor